MAIELVPLLTVHVQLKLPIEVRKGCVGTRVIFEVASAQAKGDRGRGELSGVAAADWLLIGRDGTGTQDVRASLRIDDGAIIFIQYKRQIGCGCVGCIAVSSVGCLAVSSDGLRRVSLRDGL